LPFFTILHSRHPIYRVGGARGPAHPWRTSSSACQGPASMPSFRFAVVQVSAAAAAALLCMAAATQWAAAMLGYQPALGEPAIDLLGVKLYAPWKLFTWWLTFDAQAPHVFARAGALAALGGVLSGALAIGGAARRAGRPRVPTTYGSARWADFSDVRQAGLLDD